MVAVRQVGIAVRRGIGRPFGSGIGALPEVIGRNAIPSVRKIVVPAAKRDVTDLTELAAPELAEVVSGRKNF